MLPVNQTTPSYEFELYPMYGVPKKPHASLTAHNFWSARNCHFKFSEEELQLASCMIVKFSSNEKVWGNGKIPNTSSRF